jgi:branched-chain amino acid transport system permease protein
LESIVGSVFFITLMVMNVIVICGIGSVQGAFYAALMVGVIDTAGRAFLPMLLREFIDRSSAQAAGPAIASMLTCVFMATVLAIKPQGLFPVKNQ